MILNFIDTDEIVMAILSQITDETYAQMICLMASVATYGKIPIGADPYDYMIDEWEEKALSKWVINILETGIQEGLAVSQSDLFKDFIKVPE